MVKKVLDKQDPFNTLLLKGVYYIIGISYIAVVKATEFLSYRGTDTHTRTWPGR
jgi:hypothetical protein